jgi:hypothetical protein
MDQDMAGMAFQRSNHPAQANDFRPGTDNSCNFHKTFFQFKV